MLLILYILEMMTIAVPKNDLFGLVVKQIRNFFVLNKSEYEELKNSFELVLAKTENNFIHSNNKYYKEQLPPLL
jgi:hypothetical protein